MNARGPEVNGVSEIIERVSGYDSQKTTDELYDFGKILLQEGVERVHWLDSKAGLLIGFSGAILALLLSTVSTWKLELKALPAPWVFGGLVFLALLCLAGANFFGLLALRAEKFLWPDEKDVWLAKDYLNYPEQLRRFYLVAMYETIASHDKVNQKKAERVDKAQLLLVMGTVLLAIVLLAATGRLAWTLAA